jgi:hypothetical protein
MTPNVTYALVAASVLLCFVVVWYEERCETRPTPEELLKRQSERRVVQSLAVLAYLGRRAGQLSRFQGSTQQRAEAARNLAVDDRTEA